MLDAALCNRAPLPWISWKSLITQVVMNEPLILFFLVTLTVLGWYLPRRPWRPFCASLGIILLLAYNLAAWPPVIHRAESLLMTRVPPDNGTPADAIVVLGRGPYLLNERVETAAQLWQAQRAPLIFASGIGDGPRIVEHLRARGIPAQALGDENCSQTTAENAEFTAMLLQPKGVRRIILVTDEPHMLRSLLTFRGEGFEVLPHANGLPPLPRREQALMIYREYAGMVSYALRGRFQFPERTRLGWEQPANSLPSRGG